MSIFTSPMIIPMTIALGVIVMMAMRLVKQSIKNRREQRKLELDQQRNDIRRALGEKTFWVQIRTRQNNRTDMETALIGAMVDLGIKVAQDKPGNENEVFVFIGTFDIAHDVFTSHCLDMRVTTVGGMIKAARHTFGNNMNDLAFNTLLYLASVLK